MAAFPRSGALLAALLLLAAPAAAQSVAAAEAGEDACETDFSQTIFVENSDDAQPAASSPASRATPAEARVQAILAEEGVHVVRLWAPWCSNSTGEMEEGWAELVDANADVTFTFVTVWNNGRSGARTIEEYGLPLGRIVEVVPKKPAQGRLGSFMDYAVQWVPSTWIFRTPGGGDPPERAFALDYGEMDAATLQTLIDAAGRAW